MKKIDAIKAVARNLNDLIIDSTPASITGSSAYFDVLIQPLDEQLRGKHSYIYDGAGAGQARTIGSFTASENMVGFPQSFTTLPSTNSNFLFFHKFLKDDYDNALERVEGIARLEFLEEKVATLQLAGTQYEYAVPSGYEYISTLRLVPSSNSDYDTDDEVSRFHEIPPRFWRIEANPLGSYVIAFDGRKIAMDTVNEEWVRIMGQAKPSSLGTDNATIPENLKEFLIIGASMLLSSQRISEGKEWQSKFYAFRDLYRDIKDSVFTPKRGKKVG